MNTSRLTRFSSLALQRQRRGERGVEHHPVQEPWTGWTRQDPEEQPG